MPKHDCPACICNEVYTQRCRYCRRSYEVTLWADHPDDRWWSDWYCSPDCQTAYNRRAKDVEHDAAIAKRDARVKAGHSVCRASVGKRLCNGRPLLGHDLCASHSDPEALDARAWGRALGHMAVTDDFALELLGTYAAHPIVAAYRKAGIRREEIAAISVTPLS